MQYYEDQLGPTNQKALLWFLLRAIKSTWWEHSWKISYKNCIRSHTICKGTTPCNCRLSTKHSQLKLQVEEHLQHSSYPVLKTPAASPFSLVCGVFHLSLTNCYNCCGSLRGRLMGSSEQPCRQLLCRLLKPYKAELPNTNAGDASSAASFTSRTFWQGPGNCTFSSFTFWNRRQKRGKSC